MVKKLTRRSAKPLLLVQVQLAPPRLYFRLFDRRIGGRHFVPPIGFVGGNQGRSARAGAPRGWPRRGLAQPPNLGHGVYMI